MKYVVILITNLTRLLLAVCMFTLHCNYLHILIQDCADSINWKLLNISDTIPAVVKCVFSVHKFEQTAEHETHKDHTHVTWKIPPYHGLCRAVDSPETSCRSDSGPHCCG